MMGGTGFSFPGLQVGLYFSCFMEQKYLSSHKSPFRSALCLFISMVFPKGLRMYLRDRDRDYIPIALTVYTTS